MLRRAFLKLAAASIMVPALRWTAPPRVESEVDVAYRVTSRYFDAVVHRRRDAWQSLSDAMEDQLWKVPE